MEWINAIFMRGGTSRGLFFDARDLPVLAIGDSNRLKPGQWVVAIGSPFGLDHSVTAGTVSAVGRSTSAEQRYVPFIQTDVAINQGNSGGPLLDVSGQVVGINSQIFSASGGYMGISFAIPIDLAMSAVEQIRSSGKVSRGSLGVATGGGTPPQPLSSDASGGGGCCGGYCGQRPRPWARAQRSCRRPRDLRMPLGTPA